VAGMGEKTPLRTRFVTWLLYWLYLDVFVGAGGAASVYLALTHGQVALGGGMSLVTVACMVIIASTRERGSPQERATVAAWKWWQDQDPDVQLRQWQIIGQQFAQPYADALPALEQATQHTPSDTDAWASLAYALNCVGRSEEALAASERALVLDPQLAFAWARKAGALVQLKRMEEALAASERALALDPEAASAWGNKGTALGQLGRYAEALDAYDHAVALGIETNSPWYRVNVELARCRLVCQVGKYVEGLEACDQALAAQPDLALAWYSKAICLHHCGRTAEAEVAVRRAKKLAG
jgi:tetratricopeptide (TPR) repeat protein